MTYRSTIIFTLSVLVLAACSPSETELRALRVGGIADARTVSKELHLAYLNCYPLPSHDKSYCQRLARGDTGELHDAYHWEYILPFNHEVERLGFVAFLRDHNQPCAGLDEGVQFSEGQNAYVVNCTDGNRYTMRFDQRRDKWSLKTTP